MAHTWNLDGLYGLCKDSVGEAVKMHWIIHQEALCAKTVQLSDVINTVVKTVTYIIRAQGLYHRKFPTFVTDVDAEYGDLLYHSEVHWRSHSSVLRWFYSLRSASWVTVSWAEVGSHITLNKSLQGKVDQLVSQLYTCMKALCVKLWLLET